MKTAVVYYTFGGSTKKEAEQIAAQRGADLFRVHEAKKRSLFAAFIPGGLDARACKKSKILPIPADLVEYERIILAGPVWAAYPAPAFFSMIDLLPADKEVEVVLCSGGGAARNSDAQVKRLIESRGCKVIDIQTVATGVAPGKLKES